MSNLNYPEKPSEEISREEWMEKLHQLHITRADMNRLIMNYLVTGEKGEVAGMYDCW